MGRLALARGNPDAARAALRKALTLAPDSFEAQLTLVNVLASGAVTVVADQLEPLEPEAALAGASRDFR